jgi:DNA polymerase-3 subunit epsilon
MQLLQCRDVDSDSPHGDGRDKPGNDEERSTRGMREIVFDTETTGLDPFQGHRLVEIGCVELVNRFPTGQVLHRYFNPDRDMPPEAFAVHGLSAEFLRDKPRFADIVDEIIEFIGEAPLIAHNALFDLGFLNAELERCARPAVARDRLVDTLLLARRRHPASPNSLDALCARYGIDLTKRTKHGALLDAGLLADVYIELIGGRQASLILVDGGRGPLAARGDSIVLQRPQPLPPRVTDTEREEHAEFIARMGEKAIWLEYR